MNRAAGVYWLCPSAPDRLWGTRPCERPRVRRHTPRSTPLAARHCPRAAGPRVRCTRGATARAAGTGRVRARGRLARCVGGASVAIRIVVLVYRLGWRVGHGPGEERYVRSERGVRVSRARGGAPWRALRAGVGGGMIVGVVEVRGVGRLAVHVCWARGCGEMGGSESCEVCLIAWVMWHAALFTFEWSSSFSARLVQ